jgi:hypothetical protein
MEDYVTRLTGMGGAPNISANPIGAARSISPTTDDIPKGQFDPRSYSFWLLAVIAGAVGLASVSGSIRVGPIKASAGLG